MVFKIVFSESLVKYLQRILNPAGLERTLKRWGLSGLPVGEALSLYVAKYLTNEYGVNIPGGTEILAAYLRNDYNGFITGDAQTIANELNEKKRCLNLFGMNICFGNDAALYGSIAGVLLAGFLAYKFFKA